MLARLALIVLIGIVHFAAPPAHAAYPDHPVRVIVAFAPGGAVDVVARIAAQKLSEKFGQSFYVENVPGATGNIGTAQAAKAAPDGYTLLVAFSSHVVNPSLFPKLAYDPVADFEPIALAVIAANVLVVNKDVDARTVDELIALIRANPGKFNYAATTNTQAHLLGEQFRHSRNLDLVHVPFNGAGPAITSIVGGHTPIGFATLASAISQIEAGQLRALAVLSKTRSKAAPSVPTMGEAGSPDVDGDVWVGVLAPAKTPAEITTLLHREISIILARPDVGKLFLDQGLTAVSSTREAFGQRIKDEIVLWKGIVEASSSKPK
jgi:tripartite-type tricarboxylate transporter receptor subunit TctC